MKWRIGVTARLVSLALIVSTFGLSEASAHRTKRSVNRTTYPHHESVWDDLDHCESTHGKHRNRFQFTLKTWRSMPGRAGRPETHTFEEQLDSAKALVLRSGWGQFPDCSRKIKARFRPM